LFVPIESPDRIARPPGEDGRLEVDEKLREILLDDPFDLAIEVSGDLPSRARAVMERVRAFS
jgi:hypothetical protein